MIPAAGGWLLAAVLATGALAPPVAAQEPLAVPKLERRVTDLTGTLSRDDAARLEAKLAAFEQEKGSQIAILIVPTTKPEPIEAYGIRVAETWKIGRKGVGDGLIILVAKDDRRLRIEVAKALEGAVPDASAKRIIAETITPRFKEGEFARGLDEGLYRLFRLIEGEALPPPSRAAPAERGAGFEDILPLILVGTIFAGGFLRAVLGRALGAGATGALVGGGAWLLSGSLLLAIVAGALSFFFVLLGAGIGRGGGWSGGGWSAGGGGWSHGGGGWSGGGGGDFGGGGASGNW